MKKIIPVLIISLFLCFSFCLAELSDWLPELPTSGLWSFEITEESVPTVIIGSEEIVVRGRMQSTEMITETPATIAIVQTDATGGYKALSEYFVCEPSPILKEDLSTKYKGNCDFTLSAVVSYSGNAAAGAAEFPAISVRLYQGRVAEAATTVIAEKSYSITVLSTGGGQQEDPEQEEKLKALEWESIIDFINHIINVIFGIIVSFAFIALVVGGLMMVTSAGDPAKVGKARNTIFFALAGFAIAFLSKGIVALIQAIMGVKEKSG